MSEPRTTKTTHEYGSSDSPQSRTRSAYGRGRRGERRMVPPAEPRSYYGRPVIKQPVWAPEIPVYFWTGGIGGASAALAFAAERAGDDVLARRAWIAALAGVAVSPALLISDLGVPRRFLNMLRVFKVTSPMSVGSWILAGTGTATGAAALSNMTGVARGPGRVAGGIAALLGLPLSTYTAALVADTAVPVWHEARRELPFLFAASAAASSGAAVTLITPARHAAPARSLAVGGAAAAVAASMSMEHRLGDVGEPYKQGRAGRLARLAKVAIAAGGVTIAAAGGRRRAPAAAGATTLLAGTLLERWSVFRAGFQSAEDPRYTVAPQRRRSER